MSDLPVCECNVYICRYCGHIDGDYHGSNNCIGKEYYVSDCWFCDYGKATLVEE